MAKKNLLVAFGLMGIALSANAQKVVSVGFESGEKTYTTPWALTPGGTFGDWVNKQDQDNWDEKCTDAPHSGEYCMMLDNTNPVIENQFLGNSWDRGFKIGRIPLKDNTPYRVSFWVRAEPAWYNNTTGGDISTRVKSSLSIGREYFDNELISPSGVSYNYNFANNMTGEWTRLSYVTFNTNKALLDARALQRYGENDVYVSDDAAHGAGTLVGNGAQGFEENSYFLIINCYDPTIYYIDDIVVEENVAVAGTYFYEDKVQIDLGYPTNITTLARENRGSVVLDPSCIKITVNGEEQPVEFLEGKEDGYIYAFFEGGSTAAYNADVKVEFTPSADCPIMYSTDKRPSADVESDMVILGFTGETAQYNENIPDVVPSAFQAPELVSSTPESDSFDLESLSEVSATFSTTLDITSTSAILYLNGIPTDLSNNMTLSEDLKTINVKLPANLADGDYTLAFENLMSDMGMESYIAQKVNFSIGIDNTMVESEDIYCPDFDAVQNGTFPVGWIASDNGNIHQYGLTANGEVVNYDWGGNTGGGGPRMFGDFTGGGFSKALYWRSLDGAGTCTLTYGEQVKDWILADGSVDPNMDPELGLYLEPKKYSIDFLMCAWKYQDGLFYDSSKGEVDNNNQNGYQYPKFNFTVEDLNGKVFARFDNVEAKPCVNNGRTLNGKPTRSNTDFTIDQPGYYMLKFTGFGSVELLMANCKLITMPSKASYYKQELQKAIDEAELVWLENSDEMYDGETCKALVAETEAAKAAIKNAVYHSAREIEDEIANLQALSNALVTRRNNIDSYNESIEAASAKVEDIKASKYINANGVKDAIANVEKYQAINPTTLSDAELAEAVPAVKAAANALANLEACTDLLTWGIYKAAQTAEKVGTNIANVDWTSAVSDDRAIADVINKANKLRVLQILAENAEIPAQYLTKVNERDEVIDDEETGNVICDFEGIELTGVVQNPKFYRVLGDNGVPGWTIAQTTEDNTVNIGFNAEASDANPVVDAQINIYGNADYDFSQVISNLPAGIYNVQFMTRTPLVGPKTFEGDETLYTFYYNAQDENGVWDKYIYAKSGEKETVEPYTGASGLTPTYIKNIEVGADGTIAIGAHEHYVSGKAMKHEDNTPQDFWTGTSYVDDVHVYLVAPLAGFDYKAAAEAEAVAIENAIANIPTVSAIYNVAGQQTNKLAKGVNIIKMSDNSVRKVVIK